MISQSQSEAGRLQAMAPNHGKLLELPSEGERFSPKPAEILDSPQAAFRRPSVHLANGEAWSIQAGRSMACWPRDEAGPYESVEVGVAGAEISELAEWEDGLDRVGLSTYGYSPCAIVGAAMLARGGRIDRVGSARPAGAGPLNGQAQSLELPKRVELRIEGDVLSKAFDAWCQAALLGSSSEEISARFEPAVNGTVVMMWSELAESVASASEKRELACDGGHEFFARLEEELCFAYRHIKEQPASASETRLGPRR